MGRLCHTCGREASGMCHWCGRGICQDDTSPMYRRATCRFPDGECARKEQEKTRIRRTQLSQEVLPATYPVRRREEICGIHGKELMVWDQRSKTYKCTPCQNIRA